jgi:hypothetical protein
MPRRTRLLLATLLPLAVACGDKDGDTADPGASDDGGGWGSSMETCGMSDVGGDGETVESCDIVGTNLCIEVTGGEDVADWCACLGPANGVETAHYEGGCPAGATATCDHTGSYSPNYTAVSGATAVTTHYYTGFEGDMAQDCADTGGS